jgi:hypothetical protein
MDGREKYGSTDRSMNPWIWIYGSEWIYGHTWIYGYYMDLWKYGYGFMEGWIYGYESMEI